eukprot:CAMPEP_0118884860 /NCGR_PEP_ID=MMETSP1163-20130328/23569_1 /TAXON_ID=124430 /ORGANISM="Phaeomonas parva, Strain CCMP2877" /LENGTH=788 /DNA_ID=CAMNT_0006822765 /DNA_START=235 /DNA_END=2601 /DNA_ORIENTATION=-
MRRRRRLRLGPGLGLGLGLGFGFGLGLGLDLLIHVAFGLLLLGGAQGKEYDGDRLTGSLTDAVEVTFAVRLFNATGAVGFGSGRNGDVVPLWPLRSGDDVSSLLDGIGRRVAVVLDEERLTRDTLEALVASGNIGGVVVLDGDGVVSDIDDAGAAYSPAGASESTSAIPDASNTPYDESYSWNPFGSGLAYANFDFPMVSVSGSTADSLKGHADDNRRGGIGGSRLWMADFELYFGPYDDTTDSATCLQWRNADGNLSPRCAPLGGQSSWATFGPVDARDKVFGVCNMDASALFHDAAAGANAAAASVLTLLTAADLLADSGVNLDALPLQIALAAFQGEAWGRIGSRAFARDISNFTCAHDAPAGAGYVQVPGVCLDPVHPEGAFRNVSIDAVRYAVAVDQVGRSATGDLYVHGTEAAESFPLLRNLTSYDGVETGVAGNGALPPTPLTSLAAVAQAVGVAAPRGVVLAGYGASGYVDGAHGSRFDVAARVNVTTVANAAVVLARALLLAAADGEGAYADPAAVAGVIGAPDEAALQELLDCLTGDWLCTPMQDYWNAGYTDLQQYLGLSFGLITSDPPTFYTGIFTAGSFGQPVVQHRQGAANVVYGTFARSDGNFSLEDDYVYTYPGVLEEYIRVRLTDAGTRYNSGSYALRANATSDGACEGYQSCPNCPAQDAYWASGAAASNVSMECLPSGACACPVAFHHLALDPGIRRQSQPSAFEVDASVEGAPAWTEPYWSADVGVKVFPAAGDTINALTASFGALVTLLSAVGVCFVKSRLEKEKIV